MATGVQASQLRVLICGINHWKPEWKYIFIARAAALEEDHSSNYPIRNITLAFTSQVYSNRLTQLGEVSDATPYFSFKQFMIMA